MIPERYLFKAQQIDSDTKERTGRELVGLYMSFAAPLLDKTQRCITERCKCSECNEQGIACDYKGGWLSNFVTCDLGYGLVDASTVEPLAVKVSYVDDGTDIQNPHCPNCNIPLQSYFKWCSNSHYDVRVDYCPRCGQRLDWR